MQTAIALGDGCPSVPEKILRTIGCWLCKMLYSPPQRGYSIWPGFRPGQMILKIPLILSNIFFLFAQETVEPLQFFPVKPVACL